MMLKKQPAVWVLTLLCLVFLLTRHAKANESDEDSEDENMPDATSPRTGYACEGSTLTIRCQPDMQIRIMRANYGRLSMGICNEGKSTENWNLQCMSTRALRQVSEMCDNKLLEECHLSATNKVFGDPCSLTPKYLEVQYRCEPARTNETFISDSFSNVTTTGMTITNIPLISSTADDGRERMPSSTVTSLVQSSSTYPSSSSSVTTRRPTQRPTNETDYIDDKLFCGSTNMRNVTWPRTKAGATISAECPNNRKERQAQWECSPSLPAHWLGRPDLTRCVSPSVVNIESSLQYSREHFNSGLVERVADDMVAATDVTEIIFGGDLTHITTSMAETVEQIDIHVHEVSPAKAPELVRKVNDAVLIASSNLLDNQHSDAWMDLPQSTQAETASRIMNSVEESAFQVAHHIQRPTIVINVTRNIVVEIRVIDLRVSAGVPSSVSFKPKFLHGDPSPTTKQPQLLRDSVDVEDTTWNECGDSITLTGNTIKQLANIDGNGFARVVFTTYENLDKWMQPYHDDPINDDVSEASRTVEELVVKHGDPLRKGFNKNEREYHEQSGKGTVTAVPAGNETDREPNDESVHDTYKIKEKGNEKEHEKGNAEKQEDEKIVATRIISAAVNSRLTTVVELEDPVIYTLEHKTISASHEFALAFITYFGSIASIICLTAAFITFQFFKNLQCDRNTIHKNLVLSLCIAEIVFLFGIMQSETPVLCSVIAGILHYLFLVVFAWMSIEGIQLYTMLVEVFESERSRVKWYYACGYGLPAVVVLTSAAVDYKGYGTPSHCWLSTERGFIWAFVGPACAIICVNIVMLSIAIVVMCRHANNATYKWKMNEKGKMENIRSWVKASLVLVVLLGLTWTFGLFFVVNEATAVFAYIFTVLNCTQGVFIFVCHCLMNDKVQKEYKKWVRRTACLPESLRVKYGGARASVSTAPAHSTSSRVNYLTRLLSNRKKKRSSVTSLPTSSDPALRGNGYNKIASAEVQRNSSSTTSCPRSSTRTDSCLGSPPLARIDSDSHIYSEPTLDDPCAYLEPTRIRLDPADEMWMGGADMSMIEGSVVDTDYMDDFGQRNNVAGGCKGGMDVYKPTAIDVDKYKICGPQRNAGQLSPIPQNKNINTSDSEYSDDGELCDSAIERHKRMLSAYERDLLGSYTLSHPSNYDRRDSKGMTNDDSLVRRKLLALSGTSADSDADECLIAAVHGISPSQAFLTVPNEIPVERDLSNNLSCKFSNGGSSIEANKLSHFSPHRCTDDDFAWNISSPEQTVYNSDNVIEGYQADQCDWPASYQLNQDHASCSSNFPSERSTGFMIERPTVINNTPIPASSPPLIVWTSPPGDGCAKPGSVC